MLDQEINVGNQSLMKAVWCRLRINQLLFSN